MHFLHHFACFSLLALGESAYSKFEYKFGFKSPHIALKDNSIPFWEIGGHAIASNEQVRLAPSLKSRKGRLWSRNPVNFDNWIIDVVIRVHGRGKVGADGMAFWFTTEPNQEGPIFGSKDRWNGLGLFFDSFDNDGRGNNPAIYAVVNDGNLNFDHNNDGGQQILGSCLRDFRNKPYPYRVRIEYYHNVLSVSVSTGMQAQEESTELCMRMENIHLPKNAYIGLTAATGGLADDHDVLALITHSLHDQPLAKDSNQKNAEKERLEQQYKEYYEQLEKSKQEYAAQNPNARAPENMLPGEYFEAPQDREFRQIFEGQGMIHGTLNVLGAKLDDILNRVSSMSGGAPPAGQPGPVAGQSRELVQIMNDNRILVTSMQDMRQAISDIQNKANQLLGQRPGQNAQIGGSANNAEMHQLRELLNTVSRDTQSLVRNNIVSGKGCPSCLGTMWFLSVIFAQTVLLVILTVFKKTNDNKKLY